jgi:hypothetical protein
LHISWFDLKMASSMPLFKFPKYLGGNETIFRMDLFFKRKYLSFISHLLFINGLIAVVINVILKFEIFGIYPLNLLKLFSEKKNVDTIETKQKKVNNY